MAQQVFLSVSGIDLTHIKQIALEDTALVAAKSIIVYGVARRVSTPGGAVSNL